MTRGSPQSVRLPPPYCMSENDVLLGFVLGEPQRRPGPLPRTGPAPRVALEEILVGVLAQPPCLVSFSGGRDSSALLAVALDVARRNGLPEPVAFTLRYPGVADTDETAWQELVVDHLRPASWERVEIGPLSGDILGPVGTTSLNEHGLLWPPTLHLATGWLGRARHATIITGEGGDEILGPHRATPLRVLAQALRHHPTSVRSPLLRRTIRGAAPAPVRAAAARRKLSQSDDLPWLRQPLRNRALEDIVHSRAHEPWAWRDAVRSIPYRRALVLGEANRTWLGAAYGARFVHPLLDANFVDAVARHGGPLGYAGRTDAMRRIFGDLLPDAILTRSTKATFNTAFCGPATHAFARQWDGAGINAALVDVRSLRSLWLAERVHAGTTALLQRAWLGSGKPGLGPTDLV